ncbi:MAG TPA: PKD domain-containing protein [Thermoanaerobaculia bacterium]|nr:PKD domain-containing protein [Thermoanaerobaculia bacterium]
MRPPWLQIALLSTCLSVGFLAATVSRAQAPSAAFFAQPTFVVAGHTESFLDTSSNNPTSWLWNFGDPSSGAANTSTLQNPTHVFATAGDYTVTLTATNAAGSDVFQDTLTVAPGVPSCVPNATTLCLSGGRFSVTVGWVTTNLQAGQGNAVGLTDNSGYFWFFDPTNVEIVTKVLNGCAYNNAYWVFSAGLTNAAVFVTVVDTSLDIQYIGYNPMGVAFQPIQDTNAFPASCP